MNEATARSACLPAFVAAVNLLSREVNFKLPLSLQSNKIQPRLNFSLFCGQSDDRRGLFQLSIEEGTKVLDGILDHIDPILRQSFRQVNLTHFENCLEARETTELSLKLELN